METPNKFSCSNPVIKKAILREVTPDPNLSFFYTSNDDDAKTKPKKRIRRSLFNTPSSVQTRLQFQIKHLADDVLECSKAKTSLQTNAKEANSILNTENDKADPFQRATKICSEQTEDEGCLVNSDIFMPPDKMQNNKPRNLSEFLDLWDTCLIRLGPFECTEDIEKQQSFREASIKCNNGANQDAAHYGRTLFEACQKIFELTGLKKNEIFLDLGHGIGNAPIQAAVTIGCVGRGLELVENRFSVSLSFRDLIYDLIRMEAKTKDSLLGEVDLRQGDFCDKFHLSFLTEADVGLVNNAFEIFAARSQSRTHSASLDDHIAGIFARMKPGSRMVTFYPLPLGLSLTDANNKLKRKGKRVHSHC